MMNTIIRTYTDNGPYFNPTTETITVGSISSFLYVVREAMEEGIDTIAVFEEEECKGMWVADAEPEPDGEGSWYLPAPCYELYRPGDISEFMWHLRLKDLSQNKKD
jgi:hypothetical protein